MDEIMIIEWIKLPPVVVTRRGRFEHWVWIQKHRIRFWKRRIRYLFRKL